jgi:hypothetical protein
MIEFQYETFQDEDNSWEALFVKTPDRDWHMAEPNYGTEDKLMITNIIRNIEYNESVRKSFNAFLKELNPKFGQFEKVEDPMGSYDSLYAVSLDGIIISIMNFEYLVGYETYDSGSYWEPPSSDYVEHSTHKNIRSAFGDAIGLYMLNWYQQKQEADMDKTFND